MRNVCRILQAGAGLLLVVSAGRADTPAADPFAGLLQNSPFGAPAAAAGNPDAAKALEFRSVFVDQGEVFFSLYEGSTRLSRWVGLKEEGNPFVVQSYDAAKGEVRVDYQGRTLTLGLKQARVVASVAPPPQPPAGPPAQPPAGATPPAIVPSGSPEEIARLAQIAEEIRRRRALRQQTLQAQPPGQATPTK